MMGRLGGRGEGRTRPRSRRRKGEVGRLIGRGDNVGVQSQGGGGVGAIRSERAQRNLAQRGGAEGAQ